MSKKLLLADDSITIQKVIGITFANEDYELVVVDDGDTALSKAKEVQPDLVLADVFMPGKNGYELCSAIKSDPQLGHVPVMLLTGTFEPFDEDKARQAGADSWIAKPFESQALIDQVAEVLAKAPAAAPVTDAEEEFESFEEELPTEDLYDQSVETTFAAEPEPVEELAEPEPVEELAEPEPVASADTSLWDDVAFEEEFAGSDEEISIATPAPEDSAPGQSAEFDEQPEVPIQVEEPAGSPEAEPVAAAPDVWDTDEDEEIFDLDESDILDEDDFLGDEEPASAVPRVDFAEQETSSNDIWGATEPEESDDEAWKGYIRSGEPDADALTEKFVTAGSEEVEAVELAPSMDSEPEVETEADFEADMGGALLEEEAVASPVDPEPVSVPAAAASTTPKEVETRVAALDEVELEQIVERVAGQVIHRLAGTVLERIAWEVVPDLAEGMIRDELRKIKETVG